MAQQINIIYNKILGNTNIYISKYSDHHDAHHTFKPSK